LTPHDYIDSAKALRNALKTLEQYDLLAVDTEFINDNRYFTSLEIIQLATPNGDFFIVDFQRLSRQSDGRDALADFWDVLLSSDRELVFHACLEDVRVIIQSSDRRPDNIFDTQVAFSLIDHNLQIGYLDLVRKELGEEFDKGPQMMDWSKRPLRPEMVEYALNDVRYLIQMYHQLYDKLEAKNRQGWMTDLMREILEGVRMPSPESAWENVKGANSLQGHQINALQHLAEWREEEAMRRNMPTGRVVGDDILVAIARKKPKNFASLERTTRRLTRGMMNQFGDSLLRCVEYALDEEPAKRERQPSREKGENSKALASMLGAYSDAVARKHKMARQRLVKSSELSDLAGKTVEGLEARLPVLQGWRRDLLGDDLLKIVQGELSMHWDPKQQALVATER
jgi:ribonuclease D